MDTRSEINRRRTFAIISHPDAGKTTLTEKFLLYGGAIQLAGAVKGKKSARHAVSDWMEIEKQRGISVTSSVMQFQYEGYCINILDTPGHQDFYFRFMDEVLDANYRNELRFTKQILLFSLIAIAISLTGVFGLTMFESEYRRKEIGIRKIMGSSTTQILYMFNRRYILILTGCFIVAAPFGWWIGQHWLQGFAEKTPVSPWIFILSFLLVTLITMLTITVQSWKNACENPANSIKTE